MIHKSLQKERLQGALIVFLCLFLMGSFSSCLHLPFFKGKGTKVTDQKRALPKQLRTSLGDAHDQLSDIKTSVKDTAESQRQLNDALRTEARHVHDKDKDGLHAGSVENVAEAANRSDNLMISLDEAIISLEQTRTELQGARDTARDLEKSVEAQQKVHKDLQKQNESLVKDLEKEKDTKQGILKKVLIGMTAIGFGAVGVFVFLFFNTGRIRFLYGAGGCLATAALAMTFFVYFTQITTAVIILVILLVSVGIWQAWEQIQEKKKKDQYKAATEEVVASMEHVKQYIDPAKTTELFGDANTDGSVGALQKSAHTAAIVKEARIAHDEKNKPLRTVSA